MRVFRTTYKDRKGHTREAAKWYVEFRDQLETIRRIPGFTSKAASEELGRNFDRLVGYYRSSGQQLDPALADWLAGLPEYIRKKLVSIGLVRPERVAVTKPLAEHLADFQKALQGKSCTDCHAELVTVRARRIIEGCRFLSFADISGSKILNWLNGRRQDTETKRGMSAQTFNFYLQAIKQFCRWMVRDRRASESPVAHLGGVNVKTDRRHDRRALSADELRRLLRAALQGCTLWEMSGPERAMLYRVAMETGLRAGELASLTRASFKLNGQAPTVTVDAAYSNHRREDILPLRPNLADELRSYLATTMPGAKVFRYKNRFELLRMFKAGLAAAGIAYQDEAGLFADFHSLRHSFLTQLAAGGVHPKTAQCLARHSTITLTMDRYTHSILKDQAHALEALPDFSNATLGAAMATGTEGPIIARKEGERLGVLLGAFGSISVGAERRGKTIEGVKGEKRESSPNPGNNAESVEMDSGGGEIRTRGRLATSPVFKTGAIGRSATPPANAVFFTIIKRHGTGNLRFATRKCQPPWIVS